MKKYYLFSPCLLAFLFVLQQGLNAQSIYIKIAGDSSITKSWCDIYITGKGPVYKQSTMVPSNNFTLLTCTDTAIKHQIILDIANRQFKTFTSLPGFYRCGDSIIVNLVHRNAFVLNRKE